jgi:gas vesicle protein
MIGGGLKSLSSGGENSYVQQTLKDISVEDEIRKSVSEVRSSIVTAIDQVPRYTDQYKEAVSVLTNTRNKFTQIRACITERQYGTGYSGGITDIDNTVSQEIDPLIQKYQKKYDDSLADKKMLEGLLADLDKDPSGQIQKVSTRFTQYLREGGAIVVTKIDTADTELQDAKKKAQDFNNRLVQYNYMCMGVIQ